MKWYRRQDWYVFEVTNLEQTQVHVHMHTNNSHKQDIICILPVRDIHTKRMKIVILTGGSDLLSILEVASSDCLFPSWRNQIAHTCMYRCMY